MKTSNANLDSSSNNFTNNPTERHLEALQNAHNKVPVRTSYSAITHDLSKAVFNSKVNATHKERETIRIHKPI